MFKKLFSLFAALTLSVGLWAANSVITFTSTKKLCAIPDAQYLENNFMMCERMSFCQPLDDWKNQHPEFKDLTRESFSQLKPTVFNPNAFLDANDQVLPLTIDYDESTHAGTITVNGELVKIASQAFSGCTALTSITLPEGVTSIEYQAFFECTGLTSITLPEGVTSIGGYAFAGCALTSVILPESLSSIGTDGFDRCPLSSVTIPANVTFLGYCAFGENSSLADVYVAWTTTLPTLEDNATFSWSPINNATLHVPVGSKALYQNADVWKGFGSIVEYDELQETKTAAIAEINAAIEGVTGDAIIAIATAAKAQIEQATTKSGVNSIKTQALADIAAAILAKYKADAIAEIQTAGQGIQNTNLNNWINGAITDINAAGTDTKEKVDNIKNQILSMIQLFQDGKAEGLAEAQAALPTEGTSGPAVVITQGDKSITLINPDEVRYTIITEE